MVSTLALPTVARRMERRWANTLAVTNRGSASAADVLAVARAVRDGVRERFGVELAPEPELVGCAL